MCGRKHYALMCNEIDSKGKEDESRHTAETTKESILAQHTVSTLSGTTCSPEIMLMTCLVKVRGARGQTCICRALYDSGSHLTRVKSSVAKLLDLKPITGRHLRIAVYGGEVIDAPHSLFNLAIESLNGKEKRWLKAYDENKLCGAVLPRIPRGPWLEELQEKGIRFNDYESRSNEIDIIIGNQYLQQLLTGRRVESRYGYTAVETVFGWTLSRALNAKSDLENGMAIVEI